LLAIDRAERSAPTLQRLFRRYEEFSQIVSKVLGSPLTIVAVRDRNLLLDALKKRSYALLLARPNDVPAEAIRDYGYQPVVTEKEPARALFIVKKDSPLKSIRRRQGNSLLTPDRYSSIWRVAMPCCVTTRFPWPMRKFAPCTMTLRLAGPWRADFFDVGVINSISGVGRTWEKNGGRVIARSRTCPICR